MQEPDQHQHPNPSPDLQQDHTDLSKERIEPPARESKAFQECLEELQKALRKRSTVPAHRRAQLIGKITRLSQKERVASCYKAYNSLRNGYQNDKVTLDQYTTFVARNSTSLNIRNLTDTVTLIAATEYKSSLLFKNLNSLLYEIAARDSKEKASVRSKRASEYALLAIRQNAYFEYVANHFPQYSDGIPTKKKIWLFHKCCENIATAGQERKLSSLLPALTHDVLGLEMDFKKIAELAEASCYLHDQITVDTLWYYAKKHYPTMRKTTGQALVRMARIVFLNYRQRQELPQEIASDMIRALRENRRNKKEWPDSGRFSAKINRFLKTMGYAPRKEVWVAGYRADLMIHSRGITVLIECDGDYYHRVRGNWKSPLRKIDQFQADVINSIPSHALVRIPSGLLKQLTPKRLKNALQSKIDQCVDEALIRLEESRSY